MQKAGFIDTFRFVHADPVQAPGLTWSPEFTDSHQDRIDYVCVRRHEWRIENSEVLSEHPAGWPSDHAAVLTFLRVGGRGTGG